MEKVDEGEEGKSKRRVKKKRRMVMNVTNTKYGVVKHVGKKVMNFKLSNDLDEPWDIM